METIINNQGSLFLIIRQWLDQEYANRLYDNLDKNALWINMQYGQNKKLYKMNREISLLGDGTHAYYPYEKIPFMVSHWDQVLNSEIRKIKENICQDVNIQSMLNANLDFNSCVVNRYSPHNFISYHADMEAQGDLHQVVSVSLGSSRTFHIKKNNSFEKPIQVILNHGDLLLMAGQAQVDYQHAIHSEDTNGKRISLTYRYI